MNKKFQLKELLLSSTIDGESEFFPLLSDEDEQKIDKEKNPEVLPILPLRNTVLFPGVIIPITVTRARSIKLIKEAEKNNKIIGVVSQKDSKIELPQVSDLNKIGTVAQILKVLKMPDGNITAVIQGRKRFELDEMIETDPYYKAKIKDYVEVKPYSDKEFDASNSLPYFLLYFSFQVFAFLVLPPFLYLKPFSYSAFSNSSSKISGLSQ